MKITSIGLTFLLVVTMNSVTTIAKASDALTKDGLYLFQGLSVDLTLKEAQKITEARGFECKYSKVDSINFEDVSCNKGGISTHYFGVAMLSIKCAAYDGCKISNENMINALKEKYYNVSKRWDSNNGVYCLTGKKGDKMCLEGKQVNLYKNQWSAVTKPKF